MRIISLITLVLGFTGCLRSASKAVEPAPTAREATTPSMPESFSVTAPDANWRIELVRVYEREDAVWILARIWREPGIGAQMVTSLRCEIPVALPAKPRRIFVAGKTWSWKSKGEDLEFVSSLESVKKDAGNARVLFPR
jgi:hypothetical protein